MLDFDRLLRVSVGPQIGKAAFFRYMNTRQVNRDLTFHHLRTGLGIAFVLSDARQRKNLAILGIIHIYESTLLPPFQQVPTARVVPWIRRHILMIYSGRGRAGRQKGPDTRHAPDNPIAIMI